MEDMRNAYSILVGESEGKRPLIKKDSAQWNWLIN